MSTDEDTAKRQTTPNSAVANGRARPGLYAAYKALVWARPWLAHNPRLAAHLARLGFRLNPREHQRALAHLEQAFGNRLDRRAIRRLADRCFAHIGRTAAEVLGIPEMTRDDVLAAVPEVIGREHLEQAWQNGRGVVLVGGHLGNWELLGAWMAANDRPVTVAARRIYYPPFNDLIVANRAAAGVQTVFQDQGLRPMVKTLRANGVVGLLADQDLPKFPGVFVTLFGKPAYTVKAPFQLAMLAKSPPVACFTARRPDGRHLIEVSAPLNDDLPRDREEATQLMAERWTRHFESFVRRHPEQWVWHHRRWRTQPRSIH